MNLLLLFFVRGITRRDEIAYRYISKYFVNDRVIPIAKAITRCGSATVLVGLAALISLVFWKRFNDKRIGLSIFLNLALVGGINQVLKWIIKRPRPFVNRIVEEKGFSFPSGHSMGSLAFYGFIIYLIYKKVDNKKVKWVLIFLLSIFTILIGMSRIILGVHYTTDVLAGFFLSISYLTIYTSIVDDFIGTEDKKE